MATPVYEGKFTLSTYLDYFEYQGAFFVHHNLFGYILQMSRDVLDFLEFFHNKHRDDATTQKHFVPGMPHDQLVNFITVFEQQSCLVDPTKGSEKKLALGAVPVVARWAMCYAPKEGPVRLYRARNEDEPVEVSELDAWESSFWRAIDGERSTRDILELVQGDLSQEEAEDRAMALIGKLAHHNAQFLKLSPRPMSTFRAEKSRRGIPPYIVSSMPYRCVTEHIRSGAEFATEAETELPEEITFGHLFRKPSPALGGRTYAGVVLDHLLGEGCFEESADILLVGERRGHIAASMLDHLARVLPEHQASVTVLTPHEKNLAAIQADLEEAEREATVLVGNPESFARDGAVEGSFDLVFCSEYLARCDTALLHKIPKLSAPKAGEAQDEKASKDLFMGEGDSVSLVFRHNLSFPDVDGEFFFNAGAVKFLEEADKVAKKEGVIMAVEFGDLFSYPEPSGHTEDGPLFSIHYAPLLKVGESLGRAAHFDWLVNLLDLDRGKQMLSTTRKHFRALQVLLADCGVALEDIAYSRDMFEKLLEGKASLDEIRTVEFESLNDRVMGIKPSSLKILKLNAPEPEIVITGQAAET